jgi:hypothetical protein
MARKRIIECGACLGEFEIVDPREAYEGRPGPKVRNATRRYICPHCGAEGEIEWRLYEKVKRGGEKDG